MTKTEITLRDYQLKAIDFLNNNEGKLLLAMCPSSGKTETTIQFLNQQINLNPRLRVLILPHSTNVLNVLLTSKNKKNLLIMIIMLSLV